MLAVKKIQGREKVMQLLNEAIEIHFASLKVFLRNVLMINYTCDQISSALLILIIYTL